MTPAPEVSTPPAAPSTPPGPAHDASAAAPRRIRHRARWFDLRKDIPAWAYTTLAVGSFVGVFLLWAWLSHQDFVNKVFIPKPEIVWSTFLDLLRDANLWNDVKVSFIRVTAGFLLSAVLALPIGLMLGSYKIAEGIVQPLAEFIRYIPVPALIPMLMLFFGIGELAKIMLIFIGTFFQMVLMVADEVRRVPYDFLQVSYTMGAKRGEIITRVLLKSAMPGIFDVMRLCNGWAWTYLVVSELIAANEGLGYRILKFSRFLQTPKIFVYLIILGIIGLTIDIALRKFNARLFQWADTTKR